MNIICDPYVVMANKSIEDLFDLLYKSAYLCTVKESFCEVTVLMRQTLDGRLVSWLWSYHSVCT
jgi:hypothetical protein